MVHYQQHTKGDIRYGGVHGQVLAASYAFPYAIAVSEAGVDISYGKLRRRATAVARHLIARGVTPGSVVAVRISRSADQIVGLLGVLMAGCAFLVVDPADPAERQAFMIRDSRAIATLSREGEARELDWMVDGEDDDSFIKLPEIEPGDLAYVVYTSGTTGVPNGVEITHDNLVNFIEWTIAAFAVSPDDRAGYAHGITFDAAQSEIWPYLACGAAIVPVTDLARTSADLMRNWLVSERVTIGTVPMILCEQLLSAAWPSNIPLRLMLTGGDVLKAFPRYRYPFDVVNNYGPSECTIVATSGIVPMREPSSGNFYLPTIGRAIAGVQIHLLDNHMTPVRDGEEGEVWIGGRCVGRGYRDRPELTAAKFIADPFSPTPAARLYRTGDLALKLDTGEFLFCGRTDSQIKLRGVRLEPDEIAVGLQGHPAVGAAVVTVHDDQIAGRQLVAYVTPVPGLALAAGAEPENTLPPLDEIRNFLASFLPRSHIPTYFVALSTLPMTRNGKVDYASLPQPTHAGPSGRMAESETERIVAEIVAEVLGVAVVSATDDFFMIGGHSLLATQVVIQCREIFDVELTLRDLFETPTVEGISTEIDQRSITKFGDLAPSLLPVGPSASPDAP